LNNGEGIFIDHSSDNKIIGNTVTNSLRNGIYISFGENNFISNNTALFNGLNGIKIGDGDKIIITGNNACYNIDNGISIFDSSLSIISNNNISYNRHEGTGYCKAGLVLFDCISNIVTNNYISSNNHSGIRLGADWDSYNNTIKNNMILNNKYGINIDNHAHCSHVYHNNIINNEINGYCEHHQDIWYNYELKEGNYWSDYKEKYPNAKRIWFMGIWNTPYEIEGGDNQDNYPLIKQWSNTKSKDMQGVTKSFTLSKTETISNQKQDIDTNGWKSDGDLMKVNHRNKANYNLFFLRFLERFPSVFPIIQQLLGF